MKLQTQGETRHPRVLIVEDQLDTLRSLESAVTSVFPIYHPHFQSFDVARCYQEALSAVQSTRYDFVLLDHRMPELPFPEPEVIRNGGSISDLTEDGRSTYFHQENENSKNSKGLGYTLIPRIKQRNPQTIIIGTSSMSSELESMPKPDYHIRKFSGQAEVDLDIVLAQEVRREKR